jgi:surface antigen
LVCAAVLSLVCLWSLFQPWLTASGPRGTLTCTGFGELDGVLRGGSVGALLANSTSTSATISAGWAILTALVASTTVFAVVLWLRSPNQTATTAVAGSSVAAAVFAVANLLYLNSKGPGLRILTDTDSSTNPLEGLGRLFGLSRPQPSTATHIAHAGLDAAATLGTGAAFAAMLCALSAALPLESSRESRPRRALPEAAARPTI